MAKPRVIFFQRKPHAGFNYSIEHLFEGLRMRLAGKIEAIVRICPVHNNAWFSKVLNIGYAFIRQGKGIKHITGEVHFLNLAWPKKQTVLTIHDCGMVHRKKGWRRTLVNRIYLKWPLKKAAIVTTVSSATREEIIRLSGITHPDIRIIPVPLDPIFQPSPKKFKNECPTILHIGLAPNKNFFRLVAALSGIPCKLHVVGKLQREHLAALQAHQLHFTNSYQLSQAELLTAYQDCDLLAFVSTFEGFGMPIMEAQAVGRPVLTSNTSSMPEVAGDAACLVDPLDVSAIRSGVQCLIRDDDYRESLVAKGYENCKRFDPDEIAKQYLKIYQELDEISK